jgi:hypothetical protein
LHVCCGTLSSHSAKVIADDADQKFLEKSVGYNPDRPWDREEALFAEMKEDVERLKALDVEEGATNGE